MRVIVQYGQGIKKNKQRGFLFMKVNGYLLAEGLDGVIYQHLNCDPYETPLGHIMNLDFEFPLRGDVIYLTSSKKIPERLDCKIRYMLICVGEAPDFYKEDPYCDLICCKPYYSFSILFDMIHEIMLKYDQFEQDLLHAIIRSKTLKELCQIALPIFQNPFMILGENHNLLAVAEGEGGCRFPYQYREEGTDFLSWEVVNDLILDRNYPKTFEYQVPSYYLDGNGVLCIYQNIFIGTKYAARICVDSITRDFCRGDEAVILVFSRYIKGFLELNEHSVYNGLVQLKQQLRKSLTGQKLLKEEYLEYALRSISWKLTDTFLCIVYEPGLQQIQSKGVEYECNILENRLIGSMAFEIEGNILLICNIRLSPMSKEEIRKESAYLVREKLMKAGISTAFENFYNLPDFFLQAKAALDFGKNHETMIWQTIFEDCALSYVLEHGVESLPLKTLVPRDLLQMILYDREHGTKYYETFRTYLECDLSATKAILTLYVHRSTFKYRMNRIQEMIECDFDSPKQKLYFLMMFQLLDKSGFDI